MWGSQRPSVTLQGVSLGRFLAQFSQPNVVPSAGESVHIKNYSFLRSFIISTLSSHFHTSCPSAEAVPGQHSLLHKSLQCCWLLSPTCSQPLSATLCWPEQASGHHPPFGLAIRFALFIHPSARVIPRLGFMRTCVWCCCIEIGGIDGRLLPRRNTNPFIQDPNPGSRHSVLLPGREKCKELMPEISAHDVSVFFLAVSQLWCWLQSKWR